MEVPLCEPLRASDTHGILLQKGQEIIKSSENLGWSALYASRQHEDPYEGQFGGRNLALVVVHLGGPAKVERDLSGERLHRKVQAGGLFFLPPNRDFGVRLLQPLETVHIYLPIAYLHEAAAELCVGDPEGIEFIPRLGEKDQFIEHLARTCCDMLSAQQSDLFADGVARMLAVQLIRHHSTGIRARDEANVGALTPAQLRAIREFIENHLEHPIGVADLARVAKLAPNRFTRVFRKTCGTTPYQHLINCRVKRAQELLLKPIPIAEIAVACGFTHQEHLTRLFRRDTGTTPAAYRRMHID